MTEQKQTKQQYQFIGYETHSWEQIQRTLIQFDPKFDYCGSYRGKQFMVFVSKKDEDVTLHDVLSALSFTEFDFEFRLSSGVSRTSGRGIVWIEGE